MIPKINSRVRHKHAPEIFGRVFTYEVIPRLVVIIMNDGSSEKIPYECCEHMPSIYDRVSPVKTTPVDRVFPIAQDLEEAYEHSVVLMRGLKLLLDAERTNKFAENIVRLRDG